MMRALAQKPAPPEAPRGPEGPEGPGGPEPAGPVAPSVSPLPPPPAQPAQPAAPGPPPAAPEVPAGVPPPAEGKLSMMGVKELQGEYRAVLGKNPPARSGPARGGSAPFAFPTINRFWRAPLCGRAGRLTGKTAASGAGRFKNNDKWLRQKLMEQLPAPNEDGVWLGPFVRLASRPVDFVCSS
jgi:hypothetical protein